MRRKGVLNLMGAARQESGQVFIIVLAFLLLGSLTLPPMLSFLGDALKSGKMYQSKSDELYAADSGIEDAIWQVQYDRLDALFDNPPYDKYDYSTIWAYDLTEPINHLTTNVTVQNIWIPRNVTPPEPSESRAIIESNKLMVAGTVPGDTTYEIKISFYPAPGEQDDLMIESLGIWLPIGFSYVDDSSNLEDDPFAEYFSTPTVDDYNGGKSIIWEFDSVPFASFPGVNPAGPLLLPGL
jgi:hypothetical protein